MKSSPLSEPAASARTDRFIARNLLAASLDPRAKTLLSAESGRLLGQWLPLAGDQSFPRWAKSRAFRAVFRLAVDALLPGINLHYQARKRCLEDWAQRACRTANTGPWQIVILGAGLDTLGWRLCARWPEVRTFELDRPAALRVKERALAADSTRPANLRLLPADLADETLGQALGCAPDFDPALPTLFLAEGLLMYLPPARVRSLFVEIAALNTNHTPHEFAFTFMEARADGRIRFRRSNPVVDWWLRRGGEPFRWSHDPQKLAGLLDQTGWQLRELVSGDDLRARYLQPAGLGAAPLAMGEWLALAQTKASR